LRELLNVKLIAMGNIKEIKNSWGGSFYDGEPTYLSRLKACRKEWQKAADEYLEKGDKFKYKLAKATVEEFDLLIKEYRDEKL
jgi:hypothetical protein